MGAKKRAQKGAKEFAKVGVPLPSVGYLAHLQWAHLCWSKESSDKAAASAWAGHLAGGKGSKGG